MVATSPLSHTYTHIPCIQSPVNNPIHFSCNCLLTLCHFPGNQSGRSSCDPFRNGIIVTRTTIYRFQQVNVEFFEMNIPMKYTAEKLKIYSSKLRTMLQNCGRSSNCKMPNGTVHITAEKYTHARDEKSVSNVDVELRANEIVK